MFVFLACAFYVKVVERIGPITVRVGYGKHDFLCGFLIQVAQVGSLVFVNRGHFK